MGTYVNPGNASFAEVLRSGYVDKTGLIATFDQALETTAKLVLVSRPRRFGKSYAAKMIAAFYSRGADSREMFEGLEVAEREGWDERLNRYNVIWLDMTSVVQSGGVEGLVPAISGKLLPELRELTGDAGMREPGGELKSALADIVRATGVKFVFIIDEWDAPYRLMQESRTAQDAYAEWLRSLFKDLTFTGEVIAGAYLTGILPIRKYSHQSAVSDFWEYTMVRPGDYAPFAGFTQDEVEALCGEYGLDLPDVRRWYDGYLLGDAGHAYAPYSVMQACKRGKLGSYWVTTEAYESLRPYIDMDFDGLQSDIVRAVAGEAIGVDPDTFQNDLMSIGGKDDVLTLLVHLGYLSYDEESGTARVPNEEVRRELARAVNRSRHPKLVELVRRSSQLLDDIVNLREDEVAAAFQRAHDEGSKPLFYNNEQALRSVVKSALIAAVDDYQRIEELPGGHGFADIAYLPNRGSLMPALLVELKWDQPAESAIGQALANDYPAALRDLDVPIVLVAVSYDPATKRHSCRIQGIG